MTTLHNTQLNILTQLLKTLSSHREHLPAVAILQGPTDAYEPKCILRLRCVPDSGANPSPTYPTSANSFPVLAKIPSAIGRCSSSTYLARRLHTKISCCERHTIPYLISRFKLLAQRFANALFCRLDMGCWSRTGTRMMWYR